MKKQPAIIVPKEKKEELLAAIKRYYSETQGEEIGDLKATLLLDFSPNTWHPGFITRGFSMPAST